MKDFKDLVFEKPQHTKFIGEKIHVNWVLNKTIIVHGFDISKSKFEGDCLTMQIEFNGQMRIIFITAILLTKTLKALHQNDFPFRATIVRPGMAYEFQ